MILVNNMYYTCREGKGFGKGSHADFLVNNCIYMQRGNGFDKG